MKTLKKVSIRKSTVIFLSFLFALVCTTNLKAQEIQVKGIVIGQTFEKIEILKGANIFLKGTKIGTSSNKKGEFNFPQKLNVGDVLEISYLGFLKKRVTIKKSSSFIKITLQEDDNQMLGALNSGKRHKTKRQKE